MLAHLSSCCTRHYGLTSQPGVSCNQNTVLLWKLLSLSLSLAACWTGARE